MTWQLMGQRGRERGAPVARERECGKGGGAGRSMTVSSSRGPEAGGLKRKVRAPPAEATGSSIQGPQGRESRGRRESRLRTDKVRARKRAGEGTKAEGAPGESEKDRKGPR